MLSRCLTWRVEADVTVVPMGIPRRDACLVLDVNRDVMMEDRTTPREGDGVVPGDEMIGLVRSEVVFCLHEEVAYEERIQCPGPAEVLHLSLGDAVVELNLQVALQNSFVHNL